jgi:hypothetical protein
VLESDGAGTDSTTTGSTTGSTTDSNTDSSAVVLVVEASFESGVEVVEAASDEVAAGSPEVGKDVTVGTAVS